jgi:hypothetical protein
MNTQALTKGLRLVNGADDAGSAHLRKFFAHSSSRTPP